MLKRTVFLSALFAIFPAISENQPFNTETFDALAPAIARFFDIASTNPDHLILTELCDSVLAEMENNNEIFKQFYLPFVHLCEVIKTPLAFSAEEKINRIKTVIAIASTFALAENLPGYDNNPKSLEIAADLLVNHSKSLPSKELRSCLAIERLLLIVLMTVGGKQDDAECKQLLDAFALVKRPWNHSVTAIAQALSIIQDKRNSVFLMLSNTPPAHEPFAPSEYYAECLKALPQ